LYGYNKPKENCGFEKSLVAMSILCEEHTKNTCRIASKFYL